MKNSIFTFAALAVILLGSCTSDNNTNCTVPAVSANIIGTWNATFGGQATGTATFNSDGTGSSSVSPEGPFTVEITINNDPPVTVFNFRWSIVNNTLELEYYIPNNQPTLRRASGSFPISRNECNRVDVTFTGLGDVTLRK